MKRVTAAALTTFLLTVFCAVGVKADSPDSLLVARAIRVENSAQAGIKDLVEKGLYRQALIQWDEAYGNSPYAITSPGRAFQAYLLLKNGAQFLALEKLLLSPDPAQIPAALQAVWKSELPASHPLWRLAAQAQLTWSPAWKKFFASNVDPVLSAYKLGDLATEADVKRAQALLAQVPPGSDAWAKLHWQLASYSIGKSQTAQAGAHLTALERSEQTFVGHDEIELAQARLQYQNNKLQAAIKNYDDISKGSDLWPEALEEKGWAYLRMKDYDKALSQFRTVMSPLLASQLGPEPYFAESLAHLKVCDFNGVFNVLKGFKERYRVRLTEMQSVSEKGATPAVQRAIELLDSNTFAKMGADLEKVPRLMNRDAFIDAWITVRRQVRQEQQLLKAIDGSRFNTLTSEAAQLVTLADRNVSNRAKTLAQEDLREISRDLQKLRIVEVEAIQRMFPNGKPKQLLADAKTQEKISSGEALVFPDDGETWLDELDHYRVSAKGCAQTASKGGRTL